jgi:multidrug efflux pump subunit AcrB
MAPGGRPHYTNDSDDETERARKAFEKVMPGYRMEIGGERAKQQTGFANLAQVLAISLLGIYGALLLQFGNAVKPLLVFAATPYGVAGALLCLIVMGSPFGFMAFLGIASLIGVIVSHVIVLFDFIEEMHEKGERFEKAIRDARIERLRPVLITVGATILAPISAGEPRRSLVEAALLCADWWVGGCHLHLVAACTGLLQHCSP